MEERSDKLDRRTLLQRGAALGMTVGIGSLLGACGGDEGATTTARTGPGAAAGAKLAPFDPSVAAGTAPDLPEVVAHANYANVEFFQRVSEGMRAGCDDFGLQLVESSAEGKPDLVVKQMQSFLQRGVGVLATHPVDPNAQAPVMQQALDEGVCVIGNVIVPATLHDIASQYDIGFRQGQAAAKYIEESLGGEAQVLHFNSDKIAEALKPRGEGVRAALEQHAPGAKIVVDTTPDDFTQDGGFKTASTALQKFPEIKVVVGGDTWVLGALSAFEAAKVQGLDDMFFSGVDGEKQALDRVKQGGAYKASFAWPMETLSYAWIKFAADYLQGKSIPQVITLGVEQLDSAAVIDDFQSRMADPKGSWERDKALQPLLGNISYDTRKNALTKLYEV